MGGTLLNSSNSLSVNLRATSSGKGNSLCRMFSSSGKDGGKASIRRGRAEADESEDDDADVNAADAVDAAVDFSPSDDDPRGSGPSV